MKSSKQSFSAIVLMVALLTAACDGRRDRGSSEATFVVNEVTLEKYTVTERDRYQLPIAKAFLFKTCLLDQVSRAGIAQTDFLVGDGFTFQSKRTDADGCIFWAETHRTSSLQPEKRLKIKRSFQGVKSFKGYVEVLLAFNPWHEEGELYDLRWFDPKNLEEQPEDLAFKSDQTMPGGVNPRNRVSPTRAFVSDVAMLFEGHEKSQTEISTLLTLKPAQKFHVKFEPKFVRQTIQNQEIHLSLNGGKIKMLLVVVRDGRQFAPTLQDVVAEYEGEVEISKNGVVDTNILMRVHDVAGVLSRNQAILVLSPVNEPGDASWTHSPGVYFGSVAPMKGEDISLNLREMKDDGLLVASALKKALEQLRQSPKAIDILAKDPTLKLTYDISSEEEIRSWLKNPENNAALLSLKRSYCERLYTEDQVVERPKKGSSWFPWYRHPKRDERVLPACRQNPEAFVRITAPSFVESIKGNRHMGGSASARSIAISRSLAYNKTDSTENGSNFSATGGVSFEFGVPGDLGYGASVGAKIGIGKDWFYTSSFKRASESSVETKVAEEQTMSVIQDSYEVDAVVRTCALIGGIVPGTGFYACEAGTSVKTSKETYYLVNHSVDSSPLTDALETNQWRLVIRGREHYQSFEKMMTLENTVLGFSKVFSSPSMEAKLLPDFKFTQTYPGVISSGR